MSRGTGCLILATVFTFVGCTTPKGAVEIPAGQAAFPSASPGPGPGQGSGSAASVYLIRQGRLYPVTRQLPSPGDATPQAVILALLEGPSGADRKTGVQTRIPTATRLISAHVFDTVVQINLSDEFQAPGSPHDILLRVAQVVWTLVALPDVTAARFSIDGQPVGVVTDREVPVERPVTAPDYASVAPAASSA